MSSVAIVTMEGLELDRPPGTLSAIPHAGQDSGTKVW